MKKPALLLCVFLALQVLPAQAAMIVNDHFNDGVLDPAWNATPIKNASGWTYQESGTNLTVTDIDPINAPVPDGSMSSWAVIQLSRYFDPLSDFHLDFDISWVGSGPTIQRLDVRLGDSEGEDVAWAGYYDNWYGGIGMRAASASPSDPYTRGSITASGSANIDIIRENGTIGIYWNDSLFVSALNDILVEELVINIGYYPYYGATFGTLSIDQAKLESTDPSATPEPSTLTLVGLALALGAWWQFRSKKRAA